MCATRYSYTVLYVSPARTVIRKKKNPLYRCQKSKTVQRRFVVGSCEKTLKKNNQNTDRSDKVAAHGRLRVSRARTSRRKISTAGLGTVSGKRRRARSPSAAPAFFRPDVERRRHEGGGGTGSSRSTGAESRTTLSPFRPSKLFVAFSLGPSYTHARAPCVTESATSPAVAKLVRTRFA